MALVAGMLACGAGGLAQSALEAPASGLINPQAIVFSPATGKVYAVDTDHGAVQIYNDSLKSTNRVKVGAAPVSIAVNGETGSVYVANSGDGTVSVLDGRSDAVVATVPVGSHPYSIAVNTPTGEIYVSHTFNDETTLLDGATNKAASLKTGASDLISIDPGTDTIYLLGYESGTLTVISGAAHSMSRRQAGEHAWGMALDKSSHMLYVARLGTSDVAALAAGSSPAHILPAGPIPCAIAINPRTNTLYIANYEGNSVSVIDAAKARVVATVPTGTRPQAIAFDAKRNMVYVANTHSDSITVIAGSNNAVLATLPSGKHPYALAVVPGSDSLYVANESGDTPSTVVDLRQIYKTAP